MIAATGAGILLANTYHLMLRPGAERIARLGGLHAFMRWPGPILTDSGGYQVMSLSELRTIDEDGVDFRSHVDGSRHRLTPERAVELQRLLGADITMVLDECPRFGTDAAVVASSMRRSMRWAARCRGRSSLVRATRCSASSREACIPNCAPIGCGADKHRLRRLCDRWARGRRRARPCSGRST